MTEQTEKPLDAVLIGAGIMSATMGVFLKKLQPQWNITAFERLDAVALESSDAWNNAGTGHAAYCELNYTKLLENGQVDCHKAFEINEQFELSRQFWSYLTEQGILDNPADFIHHIPHLSFVRGAEDVAFLEKRHAALINSPLFKDMTFSNDPAQLREWMPLVMEGRDPSESVAATRMASGVDVDFGTLTRQLFGHMVASGVGLHLRQEVRDIDRDPDSGHWRITVRDLAADEEYSIAAKFVFIGAGGGALELLDKSQIPEADGFGGFPVSGQWLRCTNEAIIARHGAKVYGKASVGTPPMSVPHLDTRVIQGKKELLFGPFAGFSTKFLKKGSYLDFFQSIDWDNIVPMIEAGLDNMPLTKYLIQQVIQSPEDRLAALREYFPAAQMKDWELKIAGQRVQVIRNDAQEGGVLEFGTEVVHAVDGSLAALLGASPGASTAVAIVLDVLEKCFAKAMTTERWKKGVLEMVPSYHQNLAGDPMLYWRIRNWTTRTLGLRV